MKIERVWKAGHISGSYKRKKRIPDVPKISFPKGTRINDVEDAVKLVQEISDQHQEFGVVITMTPAMRVTGIRIVSIGCVDESTVEVRDILRGAVIDGAYGIIFVHNHPGGKMKPSVADKKLLKALQKAGKVLMVKIVDALVVHENKWRRIKAKK